MRCLSEWVNEIFILTFHVCAYDKRRCAILYISMKLKARGGELGKASNKNYILSLVSMTLSVSSRVRRKNIFLEFSFTISFFAIHNARIHRMSPYSSMCKRENYSWNFKNLNLFIERKQFIQFTHAHSETVERCLNCWFELSAELMWVGFGDMWSH